MTLARELAAGVQAASMLTESLSESCTLHRAAGVVAGETQYADEPIRAIVERTGSFDRDLEGVQPAGNTKLTIFRRLRPGVNDQVTVRGERVAVLDYAVAPVPGEHTVTTLRVDLS